MIKYLLTFCLFISINNSFGGNTVNSNDFDKFVIVLGRVESNSNDFAVGDKGKAISRYQIWRVCYDDAKEFNKNIKFSYESLTNSNNSKLIVKSYLMRYEPKGDYESWARLWNSGPSWKKKLNKTDLYWSKFKKNLDNIK